MGLPQNKNFIRNFDGIVVVGKNSPRFSSEIITNTIIPPKAQERNTFLPLAGEVEQTVADGKKRMFLRLAGIAGIGSIAAMLLPKKAQAFVLGGSPTSGVVGVKDSTNTRINPAKEDGNLASINTQTQKLTFDGSSNLYVQAATNFSSQIENASSIVINPAKEDGNLQTIATNIPAKGQAVMAASMPVTIASDQGAIPVSASFSGNIGLKDTTNAQINPATDDSVTYLRRIVKLLEPMGTVDIATRQRISLDAIPAGVTLPTVSAVTAITNALPTGANVIGSLTNLATLAGQNQQMYQDVARNAFASGIRQNLSWS